MEFFTKSSTQRSRIFFEFKQRIRIINKNQKRSKRLPESEREYPQRDDERYTENVEREREIERDRERRRLSSMGL